MTHHLGRILFVAAVFFGPALTASAGLINGNFDGTTFVDPTTGNTLPTGWQLGPPAPSNLSDVNVSTAVNAATFLGPESGNQYMRFQSTANNGTKDCLLQDFSTVVGQQYLVTFWVAITTDSSFGSGANTQLDPQWNELGGTGNNTTMSNSSYFTPTQAFAYREFTFVETATLSSTRIDFHAVDATGSILLDNVSVTALSSVPEPSSLLLLGFSASIGSCILYFSRVRKLRLSAL